MSALRLFFALPAPPEVRARAAQVQAALQGRRAALPSPDGMHLTLAFLGSQDSARVPDLLDLAAAAAEGRAPFALETAGLGGFPRLSAPRVLYLAFREQPALDRLAQALRAQLAQGGIAFDAKPFRPHLTLARMKEPVDLPGLREPGAPIVFEANEIFLYQSVQGARGSEYRGLGSVVLKGS
jgi:2'-5' RNA ligase